MSTDERHDSRPEARRKLGRGLSALLGEARREEPLIAPGRDFGAADSPAPFQRAQKASSSQAVRAGFWPSWWPARWTCSARASTGSSVPNRMVPASSGVSPAMARSRLVLPAPLRPISAAARPAGNSKPSPENKSLPPR